MAVLLDYNDYCFLNKESAVNKKSLSFYSHEKLALKFVIKQNTSKKISFSVTPLINALSFKSEAVMNDSGIFELNIDASLLPKFWSGDLAVNDAGIISIVALDFSKKELK
ncbi:MAG: hypothetical protein WC376_01790 [Candidatus Nanoarchaeia archaeon]|jgi:hypothetical protein